MPIDDFTLIIPTHNRPRMLGAAVQHYSGQSSDLRIIVADSSREDAYLENVRSIEACPGAITHLRYAPATLVEEKFLTFPDLITTPFGMYCPDDDIAILGGVLESLTYLRGHADFAACHGTYYNGHFTDAASVGLTTEYATLSIDQPSPIDRLFALALRYQALTYSVQRRSAFQAARPPIEVASAHFWELYQAFALAAHGKIAALPVGFMVRNGQLGAQPDFLGDGNNWILKNSSDMGDAYVAFRAKLAPLLGASVRTRSAEHLIDLVYAVFAARSSNFWHIVRTLEADGDLSAGSADILGAVARYPNEAPVPLADVTGAVQRLMQDGWPAFG